MKRDSRGCGVLLLGDGYMSLWAVRSAVIVSAMWVFADGAEGNEAV